MNDSKNCLDVRRMLGISCAETAATFADHLAECESCQDAFEDTRRFESRLKGATQVAVPEGLASRILMAQQFAADEEPLQSEVTPQAPTEPGSSHAPARGAYVRPGRQQSGWRRRTGTLRSALRVGGATAAVAALTAVLVTTPGSPLFQPGVAGAGKNLVASVQSLVKGEHNALAEEAIAMVHASPYALAARGPAPSATIDDALEAVGLQLKGDLGEVRFAGNCLVRQQLAGHIVIEGEHGPVTVFVMPETQATRTGKFEDEKWASVVMPSDRGSIAVVGTRGEALESVVDRITRAIAQPQAVRVDLRSGLGYYS